MTSAESKKKRIPVEDLETNGNKATGDSEVINETEETQTAEI